MLLALSIRNILLIEALDLDFTRGLNVLTGETGAGKSILLDALGFVLGWKVRGDLLRTGAASGEVSAVFDARTDALRAALVALDLPADDEIILRRTLTADGRRQAFVNDRRVGAEALKALAEPLVELHGQHDDVGLLDPRHHRRLLDLFADNADSLSRMRGAWREIVDLRTSLAEAEDTLARAATERDYLTHAVAELSKFAAEAGEDARLDQRRRLLQTGARLGEDATRIAGLLGRDGVFGTLSDALRQLDALAVRAEGALDPASQALSRSLTELGEAEDLVAGFLRAIEFDPAELERVEERLFALRALARKHQVAPDALVELAEKQSARLALIEDGGQSITRLKVALSKAEAQAMAVARELTARRTEAATRLDMAMARELPALRLERTVFTTHLGTATLGAEGADQVQFLVQTNPGAPAGALNQIASGGELSRFLLALKVCLAAQSPGQVLIFDEIDRGVGGATADAVGRRLAVLAAPAQVVVVTHSPQVAAYADLHFLVEKAVIDGMTRSQVRALSAEARRSEIARMLSGEAITEAALAAADDLLARGQTR